MVRITPWFTAAVAVFVGAGLAVAAAPEALSPALQSGGWSHLVPLELPPAPAGLVPDVALATRTPTHLGTST